MRRRRERNLARERRGKHLIAVLLRAGDGLAIGQRDADRRWIAIAPRRFQKSGPTGKEHGPFTGVLSSGDLAIDAIDQRIGSIAYQSVVRHLRVLLFLSHHRFDGVAPQRGYDPHLDLRCLRHRLSFCVILDQSVLAIVWVKRVRVYSTCVR